MTEISEASVMTLLDRLAERIAVELAFRLAGERSDSVGDAPSPWMGTDKAAIYLDWPKQRLYKLCANGSLPHYKQEGRLLFHRGELERWLAQFAEGERDWLRRPGKS